MAKLEFAVKMRLGVWLDAQTNVYVGWCPSLDIYSQGRNEDEALAAVQEAVSLYVKHCYLRSILDNVLNERGFKPCEPGQLDGIASDPDQEFVSVRPRHPRTFDFDVRLDLGQLSAPRGIEACLS